jgi:hypothetical protein
MIAIAAHSFVYLFEIVEGKLLHETCSERERGVVSQSKVQSKRKSVKGEKQKKREKIRKHFWSLYGRDDSKCLFFFKDESLYLFFLFLLLLSGPRLHLIFCVSSEDGNNAQFKYWQRWKKACTLLKWNFI